jgi:hypothetical protein
LNEVLQIIENFALAFSERQQIAASYGPQLYAKERRRSTRPT